MSKIEKIKVVEAHYECRMCPTTIVGRTDDGWTIYARYRWGQLSVRVDPKDPAPHGGAAGRWILERELDPDGLAGCLSFDELREITAEIVEWPDALSPKIYDDTDTWLNELLE